MTDVPSTVQVSVSGGRTSAYMAHVLLTEREHVAEWLGVPEPDLKYVFVFANTGMEHDDTLRFVNDISTHFGVQIEWVEAVVAKDKGQATTHRVTDYASAFRNDEWPDAKHPFHAFIRKYGVPNVKFRGCTREMKLRPIDSYMRELGYKVGDYHTAIGIRADERRRVRDSADAKRRRIIYPLVDYLPTDKDEVLDWWADKPWDLAIPEWQGNCVTCFKKSAKKLAQVHAETPDVFAFNMTMESMYGHVGPEFEKYDDAKLRTFFRGNMSTEDMIYMFGELDAGHARRMIQQKDAGCSESCEMFETEQMELF